MLLLKRSTVEVLPGKCFRKMLDIRKPQPNITSIMWNSGCAEKVVPDCQSQTEIYSIRFIFWQFVGMMPDVHFGAVENELHHWAKYQRRQGCKAGYDSCLLENT